MASRFWERLTGMGVEHSEEKYPVSPFSSGIREFLAGQVSEANLLAAFSIAGDDVPGWESLRDRLQAATSPLDPQIMEDVLGITEYFGEGHPWYPTIASVKARFGIS